MRNVTDHLILGMIALTLFAGINLVTQPKVVQAQAKASPSASASATVAPNKSSAPNQSSAPNKSPMPLNVGVVTEATTSAITIASSTNDQIKFAVTSTTRFEAPGISSIKTKPTIKNVAVGDTIAIASADKATATLVVIDMKVGGKPLAQPTIFLGVVSSREASKSGTLLSLKHPSADDYAKVMVSTSTKLLAKNIDKPVIDDIKAGDKLLAIGSTNAQNVISALKAYLIPGRARSLLDKLNSANPSATPMASKSASPSASPKK